MYQYENRVLSRGIPQESVLGPLLFIIYINALPGVDCRIGSIPFFYADDSNFLIASSDVESCIKSGRTMVAEMDMWCGSSGLVVNKSKTQGIIFRGYNSKINCPFTFCVNHIILGEIVNYLGITLDRPLMSSKRYFINILLICEPYSINEFVVSCDS